MNIIKKIIKKMFSFWQGLGVFVLPVHFYEPIPDTRKLNNDIWESKNHLVGIDMKESEQIALYKLITEKYSKEFFYQKNDEFKEFDANVLYCMTRHIKPKKIIEIGSGYSTLIMSEAILKNKKENIKCELISIDPYPKDFIKKDFNVLQKEVQSVPLEYFEDLEENDILFIDSSHVLKIGSDVQYEFLQIIPRLKKGVFVHIHDIFLPNEYPKNWILKEHRFFNEQYVLQTFLTFNDRFDVILANNFLNKEKWVSGSFWILKKS